MNLARWMGLASALIACGSRSDLGREGTSLPSSEVSASSPTRVNVVPVWPRRCVSEWETLFEERSEGSLTRLAYARGEVIFSLLDARLMRREVRALDASDGGRGRVIAVAFPDELWVDAEQLLYWERQQLFEVPLAGGVPVLVLDARGGGPGRGTALVSPTDLFWTQASADGQLTEFWRRARDTGQTTALARFDRDDFAASELALGPSVLVANGTARVVAIPLDGDSPLELAPVTPGTLLGVGGRGAYYTRLANVSARGGDANEYEILLSATDGGPPARVWRGAAGRRLEAIAESGDGWLATGAYYLGSGPPRAVIVYIEASGREHVLACHPGGARIASRPVLDGNTLYVATQTQGSWAIAKISLSD